MKKITYILLATLFFINSSGYLIIFYHVQYQLKRQIRNEILKDISYELLFCITIKPEDLFVDRDGIIWKEKDEIEYHGKLFDIVQIKKSEGNLILYCFEDEKEERLIKNFFAYQDIHHQNKKSRSNYITLLSTIIHQALISGNNCLNRFDKFLLINLYLTNKYKSIIIDLDSPPPKLITQIS
ncbi:MAG: hypothetical protein N3A61_05360 [Ignavibacteria bacterium]|nr:hypothetical protein [Ignavibacteria bacterium]